MMLTLIMMMQLMKMPISNDDDEDVYDSYCVVADVHEHDGNGVDEDDDHEAGGPSRGAPSIPLDRKLSTWSRALILAIIHGRKPETSCLFATAAHPKKSSKGGSSWPTSGAQSVGSSCPVYARRTKKRSCAAFSAEVSRQRDQVRPWPGGAPSGSASGPPRCCPPRIQGDTQCFRPTRLGEDLPRWRLDALPRLEAGGLVRAAAS